MFENDEKLKETNLSSCLNFEGSEPLHEISLIKAPVLYNKLAIRQSVTRNIALIPGQTAFRPAFKLYGAEDFRITNMILPRTGINDNSEYNKLDLVIILEYDLVYTDGKNKFIQPDKAIFNLVLDGFGYPDSKVRYFENRHTKPQKEINHTSKMNIKVEAIAEAFGEVICPCTGALILEIGAFFMIHYEYITQLAIPTYRFHDFILKNTK